MTLLYTALHKHGLYLIIRTWVWMAKRLVLGAVAWGLEPGIKNLLDPHSGIAESLVRVAQLEAKNAPDLGAREAVRTVPQVLAVRGIMVALCELGIVEALGRDREVVPVCRARADKEALPAGLGGGQR